MTAKFDTQGVIWRLYNTIAGVAYEGGKCAIPGMKRCELHKGYIECEMNNGEIYRVTASKI